MTSDPSYTKMQFYDTKGAVCYLNLDFDYTGNVLLGFIVTNPEGKCSYV